MNKKQLQKFAFLMFWLIIPGVLQAQDYNKIPAKGSVTMIDLGSHRCIPCRMMEPILEKVEKRYAGIAEIIFIDIMEHKDQAARFKVRAIPTQIFYDRDGLEFYRHVGFLSEDAIVFVLKKMGIEPPDAQNAENDDL